MGRAKVFVSRLIPQPALDLLQRHVAMGLNVEDKPLSKAELISRIGDAEGLVCLLTD